MRSPCCAHTLGALDPYVPTARHRPIPIVFHKILLLLALDSGVEAWHFWRHSLELHLHLSQIAKLCMSKSLGSSRGFFPNRLRLPLRFRTIAAKTGRTNPVRKNHSGFTRCPMGILPRDVGPRGLPKRVAAHQTSRGIARVYWKSYISTYCQLTPKPLNPPPHDLPTPPFPSPFSFSIDRFLTGDPLKCRPGPMKVPIRMVLEGWGTMYSFGAIDHSHAPLCPLSAQTS